ncbi:hypothetical protein [Marinobacter sp. BSs20148]|uniref:hypothetical protein n=1 Tax=Marinobacter sp. BSs20148 TaxID=490759 RepID=UPI0002777127|nr:hypothetical protein [Marinobacter sp. BSs20148]AFP31439.1 hypothetical protein MRBBS_2503 [Marinobacter sp. BSs20148]
MKVLAIFVFFVTFYKISIISPKLYLSIFVSFFGLFFVIKYSKAFFCSIGLKVICVFLAIVVFSLAVDMVTGALLNNFFNSFFVRAISIFFISAVPAFFVVVYLLKYDYDSVLDTVAVSFWIQLCFWVITYFDPTLKVYFVKLMGGGENSVNLKSHNLEVRGFGISNEINFTSPFVSVLVCLLLLRRNVISLSTSLTQLVNSNLVVFAVVIGLLFSKISNLRKLLVGCLFFLATYFLYLFGEEFFPRLFAEFGSGQSRTVKVLFEDHLFYLNNSVWGHLFGEGIYVFLGELDHYSDVGWVHIYNYGGVFFTVLYVLFLAFLCFSAFGKSWLSVAWFGAGLILNAKGLLFSPNAFFFVIFIFIFVNYGQRVKSAKIRWIRET